MFESDPKGVICKGQPALLEACENGLKWHCLNWQNPFAWPELPTFVQCALNMHSRQQQGEIEVLLEIGRLQQAAIGKGCSPDWHAIQEASLSQAPPCTPYLPTLITYIKRQAPELMTDLSLFAKAFASSATGRSNKSCGSEFFGQSNALSWGKGVMMPHILNAALCAILASPNSKVVDGICRLLTPANLSQLTSKI